MPAAPMPATPPLTPLTPLAPLTPDTPLTSITPLTPCITAPLSPSGSQQNVDTDSGKSSCSPALLDCSFDSGIGVGGGGFEGHDLKLHKRMQQCKRILLALERDKDTYRKLRERLSKIVEKTKQKDVAEEQHNCNVCCQDFTPNDAKSPVKCCTCKKLICRGANCSEWMPSIAQWECNLCRTSKESLAQTCSWVAEQMSFNRQKYVYPMRARSEIYIPISDCLEGSAQFESVSQIGVASTEISAEQKLKIREYVEQIVAKLLGGSLEQIQVGQISKSQNYLPSIVNGRRDSTSPTAEQKPIANNKIKKDFADVTEARLRQLIKSIIAETAHMPPLSSGAVSEIALNTQSRLGQTNGDIRRRHRVEHYFEPKIYQDLLATAVLNKIVDKQGNVKRLSESTPDLTTGHGIDNNFNAENQSTTSGSSLEPRSDCSYTDTEPIHRVNKDADLSPCDSQGNLLVDDTTTLITSAGRESALSDYVASHMVPLPDLSAPVSESEEDDYASGTSSTMGEGTWEDNWLFKKKHSALKSSIGTGSVGMLVPAPKEDVRAQIGDKVADEISDLSEMGSETDDSLEVHTNLDPLNDRLLNKHLIGGTNTKIVLDELIESASMVSNTSPAADEPRYTETKNKNVTEMVAKTEAVNSNVATLQVQETDTGLVSPPETFKDSQTLEDTPNPTPLSGSIAEREYKKWNNAVEMPNNPYAPEALRKRISGSQERFMDLPNISSPGKEQNSIIKNATEAESMANTSKEDDYKRYSRDYYINDATQSACNLKRQTNVDNGKRASSDEPTIDITINEDANASRTANEHPKSPEPAIIPGSASSVYRASPVQVVEDNTSIESVSNQSLQSVHTTTSDDSDTVRVYDFKKQETIILRDDSRATPTLQSVATQSTSVESMDRDREQERERKREHSVEPSKKERPTELQIASSAPTSNARPTVTPTRGSTPIAFKFLQPKRKLIDPSQVLSFDEGEQQIVMPISEKTPIEEEVAQVMPSVKALAQAFLMTSAKCSQTENRWKSRIKRAPGTFKKPEVTKKLEPAASVAEIAEDATIPTDQSSLNLDPPIYKDIEAKESESSTSADDASTRTGVLRNNIAFFENLKFK